MSGRMSRNKGARNERQLVKYLESKGYHALRVPLSGAAKGFKHDVTAEKDGVTYTFELKVRANEYESIYHFYETNKQGGIVRVGSGGDAAEVLVMSNEFERVLEMTGAYPANTTRTVKKLFNMRNLLNGAQFLVIRGDRLGFLFIQYG